MTVNSTQQTGAVVRKSYPPVELIPWDPRNEAHVKRMYDQRVACTWDSDEVDSWKEKVLGGQKTLYWVAIREDAPGFDELINRHIEAFQEEFDALVDTAANVGRLTREASNAIFHPVGHVGVEEFPDRNTEFKLPASTLWVKSLYISWALQSTGLGRNTMAQLEKTVAAAPFSSQFLALDTVTKEFELLEENLVHFYDDRGVSRPEPVRSNEVWYTRQGYTVIGRNEEGLVVWTSPVTGESSKIPLVFLKKAVA